MSIPTAAPEGEKITITNGLLHVPDNPIVPFVEGDGTGRDIWRASVRVFDAAVAKAYKGRRKISWYEVLAGEKAYHETGNWLPDETVAAFQEYLVGIKGPLTTPIGGGIRSLNVALRQMLDLYVCLRPVRHFAGVPSPVRSPDKVDMVIFRENTEDIYTGIEYRGGTPEAAKVLDFLNTTFTKDFNKIRFGTAEKANAFLTLAGMPAEDTLEVGVGIKPVSRVGTERLVDAAIQYAMTFKRKSVTIVHKGNIQKFTEGAFRDWGYAYAERVYGDKVYTWAQWEKTKNDEGETAANAEQKAALAAGKILIKDAIADIALQQVLTRPDEFDVIATLNLNGDYLSDALAAQVGGIGIAPGGNINYVTGHAIFEATHGTAPKYADLDKVNPGSVILSGDMMLRYMGWTEAADLIIKALERTIGQRIVTYDFARLMDDPTEVKTSTFADALIANMDSVIAGKPPSTRTEIIAKLNLDHPHGKIYPRGSIGTVMTRQVMTIRGDQPARAAVEMMIARKIHSLLVRPDSSGQWGIMTTTDVVNKLKLKNKSIEGVTVDALATRPLVALSPEASLLECAELMESRHIRHVAVSEGGVPIGIVSQTDVSRSLLEEA